MKKCLWVMCLGLLSYCIPLLAEEADHISQYGITWTFDKAYPIGQFVTGDWWVAGPVNVVGITTDVHSPGFTPKAGEDGSMVNPGTGDKQGYDNHLDSYDAELNAALIGGRPVSPDNPLKLKVDSSLISMVSWLYNSEKDAEPGIPKFNGATKAPRPVTRTGAILTVLPKAPPQGSFRPPYAGNDKAVKFNFADLDLSKLRNLDPVANTPDPENLTKQIERPWIDHVHEFKGAMVHPSENMPNYGEAMTEITGSIELLLNLNFSKLPGSPKKDKLAISLVQFGIDSTGIADNGGGWPENGGHGIGRKFPILFAGVLLNDSHMKEVGQWKTRFQEDEQTYYVSQADVDMTHSSKWKPDKRGGAPEPYTKEDIGMPEWTVRHTVNPETANREWGTPYRHINGTLYPSFVLAARLMGLEETWNHPALFDYADRYMKLTGGIGKGGVGNATHKSPQFFINMWNTYRTKAKAENP